MYCKNNVSSATSKRMLTMYLDNENDFYFSNIFLGLIVFAKIRVKSSILIKFDGQDEIKIVETVLVLM